MTTSAPFVLLDIESDGRLRRVSFEEAYCMATVGLPRTLIDTTWEFAHNRAIRRFAKYRLFSDAGRFLAMCGVPVCEGPNDNVIDALVRREAAHALYGQPAVSDDDVEALKILFAEPRTLAKYRVPELHEVVLSSELCDV